MAGADDLFPTPLAPDPAVALDPRPIKLPTVKPGPVHGAQFVVEIAGPKSVPAAQAHALLGPQWNPALGTPEVWAMSPADQFWMPMRTSDGGSYDSLALSWDLAGARGELSTTSARVLLQTAERFANGIGRRAFPFPAPEEIDPLVRRLLQAREAFDIGVELFVQGPRAVSEKDVWMACAALGLDLRGDGLFAWRVLGWEDALLHVAPVEENRTFSLSSVQRAETHESLSVGFNVPTSPEPAACLLGAFHAAEVLALRLQAQAFNDEGRALDDRTKRELADNLRAAVNSMKGSGLEPGSAICRKLFG